MKKRTFALGVFAATLLAIYLNHASCLAPQPEGGAKLYAHRGVHQPYERAGLTNETCTAARMLPPTHAFLENTIPSMAAAFDAGVDRVVLTHRTSLANAGPESPNGQRGPCPSSTLITVPVTASDAGEHR